MAYVMWLPSRAAPTVGFRAAALGTFWDVFQSNVQTPQATQILGEMNTLRLEPDIVSCNAAITSYPAAQCPFRDLGLGVLLVMGPPG